MHYRGMVTGRKKRTQRAMKYILITLLIIVVSGCSSPYMIDRGNDAKDIFTVSLGVGAGAKIRASFINVGLFGNSDYTGLSSSGFFSEFGDKMEELTTPLPFFSIHAGGIHSLESCQPKKSTPEDLRNKEYSSIGLFVPAVCISSNPSYYTSI